MVEYDTDLIFREKERLSLLLFFSLFEVRWSSLSVCISGLFFSSDGGTLGILVGCIGRCFVVFEVVELV